MAPHNRKRKLQDYFARLPRQNLGHIRFSSSTRAAVRINSESGNQGLASNVVQDKGVQGVRPVGELSDFIPEGLNERSLARSAWK